MKQNNKPRILLIDIETSPIITYVWELFSEQGGLPMMIKDWSILSWSAKWYDCEDKTKYPIMFKSQKNASDIYNEKEMLKKAWSLLDECDIIVGHNVKKFDIKKLNARFVYHGLGIPSSYRVIDTYTIAKKYFALTSNKLEYLANYLNCKYKKLTNRKFHGIDLWKNCLAKNPEAWDEMEKYNKRDVVVLEEVYKKLIPWDNSINFSVFYKGNDTVCSCGSTKFVSKGYSATNFGIYKRFKCSSCGKEVKSKQNELSLEKRKSLKK